jgi:hypothetical protein
MILQQIERCRVEPLQIVEEHGQRMFPCEYADKPTEHQLEAALRILSRKLRNRWLFSYDELQFENQIHNELGGFTVWTGSDECRIMPRGRASAMM